MSDDKKIINAAHLFSGEEEDSAARKIRRAAEARRRKQQQTRSLIRRVIQLIFFILMPGAFAAGYQGVLYLFNRIGSGAVLEMEPSVKVLIGLVLFTIVFGRFFCGYACAFGALGDLVHGISAWMQTKVMGYDAPYDLPIGLKGWLRKLKYVVLIVSVLLCTFQILPENMSPFTAFTDLMDLRVSPANILGIIFLVLILMGEMLQERFFCQFLCPMGAVFAMLPILPFASLSRKDKQCPRGCDECVEACPASLKVRSRGEEAGECFSCDKCMGACPKHNLSRGMDFVLRNDYLPAILNAVLFLALGCFAGMCRFF